MHRVRCSGRPWGTRPLSLPQLASAGVLLLISVLTHVPAAHAESDGIIWEHVPLDHALARAKATGKHVLVDVYATWCGPCQRLDRETFVDPVTVAVARDLITVKVDGDTAPGELVVDQYNVVGYPTVLLLTPDGEEVDRVFGFVDAPTFADLIGGYLDGRGTLADLQAQVQAHPDNVELLHQLCFRRILQGDETGALANAEALRALRPDDHALHAELQLELGKYLYLRGRDDYALARTYLEELRRRWPDSDYAEWARYPLARATYHDGDQEMAFALLGEMLEGAEGKNLASACNTIAWFCFREQTRLEWAEGVAQRGLSARPSDVGLLDTLASLQHLQGKRDAALATIDQAIELAPDDPYLREQRSRFSAM